MIDDDLNERFLQSNANVDFMAAQLAEMLRSAMRAAAASSDGRSQTYRAAESLTFFVQLLQRAEKIKPFELLEKAIDDLRVDPDSNGIDDAIIHAAKMGMRFLVESSCLDGAARGRASSRRQEFLSAIRAIDDAREQVRRGYRPSRS